MEIGKNYIIVRSTAGNEGKVVRVLGFAGKAGFDGCDRYNIYGDRYYIDQKLKTNFGRAVNHFGEFQLKKIDFDAGSWDELSEIWNPLKTEV